MLLIYRYLINFLFPVIIIIIYLRTLFKKEDKIRFKEKLFSNFKKILNNDNFKDIWYTHPLR